MAHVDLKYFKACLDGYSIHTGETIESGFSEINSEKKLAEDLYREIDLGGLDHDRRPNIDEIPCEFKGIVADQYSRCDVSPLVYEAIEFVKDQKRIACELAKEEGIVDDLGRRIYTREEKKTLHYGKIDREVETERILRWVKEECKPGQIQIKKALWKLHERFSASQKKCKVKGDYNDLWLKKEQYECIKKALIEKGKETEKIKVIRKEEIGNKRFIVRMVKIEK